MVAGSLEGLGIYYSWSSHTESGWISLPWGSCYRTCTTDLSARKLRYLEMFSLPNKKQFAFHFARRWTCLMQMGILIQPRPKTLLRHVQESKSDYSLLTKEKSPINFHFTYGKTHIHFSLSRLFPMLATGILRSHIQTQGSFNLWLTRNVASSLKEILRKLSAQHKLKHMVAEVTIYASVFMKHCLQQLYAFTASLLHKIGHVDFWGIHSSLLARQADFPVLLSTTCRACVRVS
jgi:hypothetical protein